MNQFEKNEFGGESLGRQNYSIVLAVRYFKQRRTDHRRWSLKTEFMTCMSCKVLGSKTKNAHSENLQLRGCEASLRKHTLVTRSVSLMSCNAPYRNID